MANKTSSSLWCLSHLVLRSSGFGISESQGISTNSTLILHQEGTVGCGDELPTCQSTQNSTIKTFSRNIQKKAKHGMILTGLALFASDYELDIIRESLWGFTFKTGLESSINVTWLTNYYWAKDLLTVSFRNNICTLISSLKVGMNNLVEYIKLPSSQFIYWYGPGDYSFWWAN